MEELVEIVSGMDVSQEVSMRLPVSAGVRSPYFQTTDLRKVGAGRDTKFPPKTMKAIVGYIDDLQTGADRIGTAHVDFYDETNDTTVEVANIDFYSSESHSYEDFASNLKSRILSHASGQSYTMTAADIIWAGVSLVNAMRSFTNPSRTINSAFQISTTRDAMAFYSVSIPTSLSLSGGENGAVVLEYADDSGISTNVVTVGTVRNGNTGTLTLGLNTLASMGCQISGMIPAGKYARLRPVDTTGSPVQAFVSAQEVLI